MSVRVAIEECNKTSGVSRTFRNTENFSILIILPLTLQNNSLEVTAFLKVPPMSVQVAFVQCNGSSVVSRTFRNTDSFSILITSPLTLQNNSLEVTAFLKVPPVSVRVAIVQCNGTNVVSRTFRNTENFSILTS